MEVSGSHWKPTTACVCSRRELSGVVGSHWESLGAVGVNFPTKVPGLLGQRRQVAPRVAELRLEVVAIWARGVWSDVKVTLAKASQMWRGFRGRVLPLPDTILWNCAPLFSKRLRSDLSSFPSLRISATLGTQGKCIGRH